MAEKSHRIQIFSVDLLKLFQLYPVNQQSAPLNLNRRQTLLGFITKVTVYISLSKNLSKAFINVFTCGELCFSIAVILCYCIYETIQLAFNKKNCLRSLVFVRAFDKNEHLWSEENIHWHVYTYYEIEKQFRIKAFLLFVKSDKQPTVRECVSHPEQ